MVHFTVKWCCLIMPMLDKFHVNKSSNNLFHLTICLRQCLRENFSRVMLFLWESELKWFHLQWKSLFCRDSMGYHVVHLWTPFHYNLDQYPVLMMWLVYNQQAYKNTIITYIGIQVPSCYIDHLGTNSFILINCNFITCIKEYWWSIISDDINSQCKEILLYSWWISCIWQSDSQLLKTKNL